MSGVGGRRCCCRRGAASDQGQQAHRQRNKRSGRAVHSAVFHEVDAFGVVASSRTGVSAAGSHHLAAAVAPLRHNDASAMSVRGLAPRSPPGRHRSPTGPRLSIERPASCDPHHGRMLWSGPDSGQGLHALFIYSAFARRRSGRPALSGTDLRVSQLPTSAATSPLRVGLDRGLVKHVSTVLLPDAASPGPINICLAVGS